MAPRRLQTVNALKEVILVAGCHYIALRQHASTGDVCLGESFERPGVFVSLYHLREAASLGLNICMRRSLRGWLSKNRELTGEDYLDPSLYDEVWLLNQTVPGGIASSSQEAKERWKGPISSVFWTNVQSLMVVSAISRAWFTVKEDMLAIVRNSARSHADVEKMQDRVDSGAHTAIQQVVLRETKEYVRVAQESGSVASGILDCISGIVAHGLEDDTKLNTLSEDDLATTVSNALGNELFGLIYCAGCAWASVLEGMKHPLGVVLESLVQQCLDGDSLSENVRFMIEQLSGEDVQGRVREVAEVVWNAIGTARVWVAALIKSQMCLAMASGCIDSLGDFSGGPSLSIQNMLGGCMQLVCEGAALISPQCQQNWEWKAMLRDIVHHYVRAKQVIAYSTSKSDAFELPWNEKIHEMEQEEWYLFYQNEFGNP
jgi:hypothetical protein